LGDLTGKKAKFGRPKTFHNAPAEESISQSLPPAPPQPPPAWAIGETAEAAQIAPAPPSPKILGPISFTETAEAEPPAETAAPASRPAFFEGPAAQPAAAEESPAGAGPQFQNPQPPTSQGFESQSQGPIFSFPQAQASGASPMFAPMPELQASAAGQQAAPATEGPSVATGTGSSPFPFSTQPQATQPAETAASYSGIVVAAAPIQTDEVIARLAKPGPQVSTTVTARKRSKTFIWIAAGCLVVLSVAIFIFFRNPSSLPKIMNAGAPPVATEPQAPSPFPAEPAPASPAAQAPATAAPAAQTAASQPVSTETAPQAAAPVTGPTAVEGESPVSQSPSPQAPQTQAPETAPSASNGAPAQTAQAPAAEQPSTGATPAAAAAPQGAAPQQQAAAQNPPQTQAEAAGSEAIDLVKNYPLDGDRKSVGAWLQYSFMADPNENNKEEWTPGALDATTYAVQYRVVPGPNSHLTQPISYVFEADLQNGTVMGKNPAAKDLLSGVSTEEEATPSRRKVSIKPKEDDSSGSGDSNQAPQSSNPDSTQQNGDTQQNGTGQ
jgi:hypothetical protein